MTRDMYENKCNEEFSSLDSNGQPRYEKLDSDRTPKLINKIKYRLNKSKANSKLRIQLNGDRGIAPRMYGQVKVHKPGYPLCFIFSMCQSPVNSLSKYFTKLFWPFLKNCPRIILLFDIHLCHLIK